MRRSKKAYLSADSRNLPLAHNVESNHISQTATLHVFHHHPEVQTMEVTVQKVDNILVLAVLHNQNLIDDQILLGLQVQVHLLDSNTLVGVVLVGSKNTTRRTLADFIEMVVQSSRVPGRTDGKES